MTDLVYDPDGPAILGSIVYETPVALDTVPVEINDVSALEGCPRSCTTALSHNFLPFEFMWCEVAGGCSRGKPAAGPCSTHDVISLQFIVDC